MAQVQAAVRLIAAVLIASGCNGAHADLSGGYIYKGPMQLQYLTVTAAGHQLSGYIQVVEKTGRPPNGYTVNQLRFSGEISGSSFTLRPDNFARFFGGGVSDCSGKTNSDGFSLFVPLRDGKTWTIPFKRSTPDQWNKAVTQFESACESELASAVPPPKGTHKETLGRLGQAKESASIYAEPNTASKVYYKIKAYEYVVLQPGEQGWYRVLLQSGEYGYIPASKVAKLPYHVTTTKPNVPPEEFALGQRIADFASKQKGAPAVEDGTDLQTGIGSSQFVRACFSEAGLKIPVDCAGQLDCGKIVKRLEQLIPGDRLYFHVRDLKKADTAGIYLGDGDFIFADVATKAIRVQHLNDAWLGYLCDARRAGPKS